MAGRETYTVAEIKDMLLARIEDVVQTYAPPAKGSHTTHGKYFTLNPGRADKSVGSFWIQMTGSKAGNWRDHATGDYGDVLDLIGLSLGTDAAGTFREARAFLGLATLSPEDRRAREQAAARAKARRREAERVELRAKEKRSRRAMQLWLSGRAQIKGTPVEGYLRGARGIDLARLGRQPGALRYLERTLYRHMDDDTGEVFERDFPAMATVVVGPNGKPAAVHRTYLDRDPASGAWVKAPVPAGWPFPPAAWKAKKVYGDYAGCWITIANGTGPNGGRGASLWQAAAGQHVYITEGIEDALSVAILLPDARVIAAVSLSNIGNLALPKSVTRVTIVADLDENDQARAQLQRALAQHQEAGREVRLWQNAHGGKDLNDAVRAALSACRQGREGAA